MSTELGNDDRDDERIEGAGKQEEEEQLAVVGEEITENSGKIEGGSFLRSFSNASRHRSSHRWDRYIDSAVYV